MRELNPGYKEVLKFTNDMVRNGYMDLNLLTLDENALVTYIESGRVFCWFGNPAQADLSKSNMTSYGPILSDTGSVPTVGINSLAGTGWIKTFVSKNCENPETLAKALSFATSEEGLWLNYYGVEGEDYTVQENGTMVRTEEGLARYKDVYAQNIWLWPFNDTDFFWQQRQDQRSKQMVQMVPIWHIRLHVLHLVAGIQPIFTTPDCLQQ